MRRPGLLNQRKMSLRRQPVILFSTRKGWVQDRPHPPQCALAWGTFPRKAFGGNPPIGYQSPFRPTDSPGRAAGQAAARKRFYPHLPFRPTDSPGRARLAEFAGRSRRKNQSCFDRLRRPNILLTWRVPASPARVGVQTHLGRGLQPSRTPTAPVHCPPERSANLPRPSQNSHRKRD